MDGHMWYELLIDNEYADYLMNEQEIGGDAERAAWALDGLDIIISALTYVWTFDDFSPSQIEAIRESLNKWDANALRAFDYGRARKHLSKAKQLGEITRSARDLDLEEMSAEQCAVWLMYPFWERMGGSFEKEFHKSGNLKKGLSALKRKCAEE